VAKTHWRIKATNKHGVAEIAVTGITPMFYSEPVVGRDFSVANHKALDYEGAQVQLQRDA
jgi:hypothetical protein